MARNGIKSGGRKKGTTNKATAETKQRALFVMELIEREYLVKDIKALSESQRMSAYVGLMEYVLPKLARVEANVKGNLHLSDQPVTFE